MNDYKTNVLICLSLLILFLVGLWLFVGDVRSNKKVDAPIPTPTISVPQLEDVMLKEWGAVRKIKDGSNTCYIVSTPNIRETGAFWGFSTNISCVKN